MPSMAFSTSITTAIATAAMLVSYAFWAIHLPRRRKQRLRRQLPADLDTWRMPGNCYEDEEKIWQDLDAVFRQGGFTPWKNVFGCTLVTPNRSTPRTSGFGYVIPSRRLDTDQRGPGTAGWLGRLDYRNPLSRAVRLQNGQDAVVRVIVIKNEGHEHLKILRKIAAGENALYSNNHTLPMVSEFQFEDIIFGVFPKVGGMVLEAYDGWPKNSVGDIVDMIMQMLEALAFIHDLNIAHRDAFRDNFLLQWHPESLSTLTISTSRPRVYLIDFEVAVEFPQDCSSEECVCVGYPIGGSFSQPEMYSRPRPPELESGEPYNPFKLDVWQLGISLTDFESTIASIDEVIVSMVDLDAVRRPHAKEVLERLGTVVNSMTPQSLLIKPVVKRFRDGRMVRVE